jgi:hypothetical protein
MKFKSLLLVLIFFLTLSLQAQDNGKKMDSKEIKLLVDSVGAALKRWYIYPEKADLISKAIKDKYESGAYDKLQNSGEVANMMQADIRKAHRDGHMRLMYAPRFEKQLISHSDSQQKEGEEMRLRDEQAHYFYFKKAEIMPGNIGYIRWDVFVDNIKEARPVYEAAFKLMYNAKALIIDLRYNGGGNPETVNAMLSCFFDKKLPMNHIINYKHDTVKYYTDPNLTDFKLKMPVYILTGKNTFSGAEGFAYSMKVSKRATIVGDTTRGGAHPTQPFPLGQGFVMDIPNARSYNEITKSNWEGTGVYPDVSIKAEHAFEKAQLLIAKDLLAKADGKEEKQQTQGILTIAENKLALVQSSGPNFTPEQLQKFCGQFNPGLTIVLKGSCLYRSIPGQPDCKLTPISNTRFVLDNDEAYRYIDFTIDKNDNVSGLSINRIGASFSYDKAK